MKAVGRYLLCLLMVAVGAPAARAATPVFTHGVASGDVTSSSAILWTRVDIRTTLKLEVWDNPGLTGKKAFQSSPRASAARDFTVKVDATGLEPDTQYYYRFRHDEVSSPVGTFRTAPDPGTPADVVFTQSGDSDGTLVNGAPFFNMFEVLDAARAEDGDFFVYNGDTIYSDSGLRPGGPAMTLDEYRAAYRVNRTYEALTDLLASTSIYALADDHEIQNDYEGATVDPARYAAGRRAFLEYMPVRETGLPPDPSCAGDPLYRRFQWGSEVDVFVLDERSCRSADVSAPCGGDLGPTLPTAIRTTFPFNLLLTPAPPPGCLAAIFDPSRTVLGPVQKARFLSDLLGSTAKWKFVLNEYPIQQFHALPYDRWEGYGAERNEILNFIRDNGITNVHFLTTDTHSTIQNDVFIDRFADPGEIARELVVGPIATNTFQAEVLAQAGQIGLTGINIVLGLDGIDCRHLDRNSYALVEVSAGLGTATLTSRDTAGAAVLDQGFFFPCTATYGP
jgi:alkaline phosphatase D